MSRELQNNRPRHWGWGVLSHQFDRSKAAAFLSYLKNHYRLKELPDTAYTLEIQDYQIPVSQLAPEFIKKWQKRGLVMSDEERLIHALGKSYKDLIRMRTGQIERFPDGVLYLQEASHLKELYSEAHSHNLTLIPFGGGTSVVGGCEAMGEAARPILVVDLKHMDKLIQLDKITQTARFEAGILGPRLEEVLQRKGFTSGHFPQSFEFSTLGGWVATRSAGQNSTKYGKIEERVHSLSMSTPAGKLAPRAVPASASGPNLKEICVGSEGLYGVITDVTLKIDPLPESQKFVTGFFKSFKEGIHCMRLALQQGLKPSIMRLSDVSETEMYMKISNASSLKKTALAYWMRFKKLGNKPCFFMMAVEGSATEVAHDYKALKKLVKSQGGADMGDAFGQKTLKDRFELPYLRDDLMDHGFFIDTLETAAPWSQLQKIYSEMTRAFAVVRGEADQLIVGCHVSHCYVDGASLYFTILGMQKIGHELAQWHEIKDRATRVIVKNGGALSHHHGIGSDHKKWMVDEQGELGLEMFRAMKHRLDPEGRLNPGKLL